MTAVDVGMVVMGDTVVGEEATVAGEEVMVEEAMVEEDMGAMAVDTTTEQLRYETHSTG